MPDDGQMHDDGLAIHLHRNLGGRGLADAVHGARAHDRAGGDGRGDSLLHDRDLHRHSQDLVLRRIPEHPAAHLVEVLGHTCALLVGGPHGDVVVVDADLVSLALRQAHGAVRVDGHLADRDGGHVEGGGSLLRDGHIEERTQLNAVFHVLLVRKAALEPQLGLQHDPQLEALGEEHPGGRREADVQGLGREVRLHAQVRVEVHEATELQRSGEAEAEGALKGAVVVGLQLAAPAGLDGQRRRAEVEPQRREVAFLH
mmetsp:Transcript_10914/g.38322  ORF Transcript_10914/g.38322 Transcript_10914/m.38322 type:complete len:257 (+) Transcript_10914:2641-3411(+)